MSAPYSPPQYRSTAFNCPFCGAYSRQSWGAMMVNFGGHSGADYIAKTLVCQCERCNSSSFWKDEVCVFPTAGTAPLPNPDMPPDVMADYEEAKSIISISPRGAAALLRLSIQKLCKHLGEAGENINADIASMVKKGLPEPLQQALDSVRVVGNNAVHPGQIDFTDDASIAGSLFGLVNIICDNRITQPKMISQYYHSNVPAETRGHIAKRDGKQV